MRSTAQTLDAAFRPSRAIDRVTLSPKFRYLRVEVDGRPALLVLGYVDEDPAGRTEVWYSAAGEVLKLRNGRVVGALGTTTEWRRVVLPALPQWRSVTGPVAWTRERDVMPGYRFGRLDRLELRPLAPAPADHDADLSLHWFEERMVGGSGPQLPPARYAVHIAQAAETVVKGEQCLTPTLCLRWERWPRPTGAGA